MKIGIGVIFYTSAKEMEIEKGIKNVLISLFYDDDYPVDFANAMD